MHTSRYTKPQYIAMCIARFPDANYEYLLSNGWNIVSVIRDVGEKLFTDMDCESELAYETIMQLRNLKETGRVSFHKEEQN